MPFVAVCLPHQIIFVTTNAKERWGFTIDVNFLEPGEGKGMCDTHFGVVAKKFIEYLRIWNGRLTGSFAPVMFCCVCVCYVVCVYVCFVCCLLTVCVVCVLWKMANFLNDAATSGLKETTVGEIPLNHRDTCPSMDDVTTVTNIKAYKQFWAVLDPHGKASNMAGQRFGILGRRLTDIGPAITVGLQTKKRTAAASRPKVISKMADGGNVLDAIQLAMCEAMAHFDARRDKKWRDVQVRHCPARATALPTALPAPLPCPRDCLAHVWP